MFRKFAPGENVDPKLQQLKSSVQRGIRTKIAEQYPQLEDEVLDELIPKKCVMNIAKTDTKISVVLVDGVPAASAERRRVLSASQGAPQYPDMMPKRGWTRAPSDLRSRAPTSCARGSRLGGRSSTRSTMMFRWPFTRREAARAGGRDHQDVHGHQDEQRDRGGHGAPPQRRACTA